MKNERPGDKKNILENKPFIYSVLEFDQALDKLYQSTLQIARNNVERASYNNNLEAAQKAYLIVLSKLNYEHNPHLGCSMSGNYLAYLYKDFPYSSYNDKIEQMLDGMLSGLGRYNLDSKDPKHRDPAAVMLGYLTDMITIGNDNAAPEEQRIEVVAKALKKFGSKHGVGPDEVGTMIERSLFLCSNITAEFDPFINSELIIKIAQTYSEILDPEELVVFNNASEFLINQAIEEARRNNAKWN